MKRPSYRIVLTLVLLCACLTLGGYSRAQEAEPQQATLITNARVFDGENEALIDGVSVLVEGNKIPKIGKSLTPPAGATVIDAGGRVLMPGLIDAHWHSMFNFWPISRVMSSCGRDDNRMKAARFETAHFTYCSLIRVQNLWAQ